MDFKNELARLVIIMGIPFGNFNDFRIQAKKLFLEEQHSKMATLSGSLSPNIDKGLSFYEWYNYEAMLQVNQAMGRVKRNEEDYGLVMLIDSRFSESKFHNLLGRHIKELYCTFPDFKSFRIYLTNFYRENLRKSKRTDHFDVANGEQRAQENTLMSFLQSNGKPKEPEKPIEPPKLISENGMQPMCSICYDKYDGSKEFLASRCNHYACKPCWETSLAIKLECMICKARTRLKTLDKFVPN